MNSQREMPFLAHLEELRWRVIKIALSVLVFAIPGWIYWEKIFELVMLYPLRLSSPTPKLIYTTPAESVVLSLKIALATGVIAAAPVIFFQIWHFVSPGLYGKEKKVVLPVVLASTILFIMGIMFSYLTFPYVMRFLTMYAAEKLNPFFKAGDYFSFLLKISFSFGVIFELPVVSFVLARMGILSAKFLLRNFRYAIVLIFIVAAVLTPPDVLSQTFMALPLMVLYLISVAVAGVAGRRSKSIQG
ncbi:MAG TPA: twin-arginine translocase subunit TatC [Chitinispirillaceae bacterium]|nr:twin-arginine translocase subunit TatC [Chitinispirillaceae bacterium]